jgi:DNA-binding NtrC family response regulator
MKRILILDDEIDVVDTIAGILKDEGYQVDSTTNCEEVLKKLEQFRPNLVTLDLNFGTGKEQAGIDILREIRSRYPQKDLPILVISGTGDAVKLAELLKLGMDGYIYKPIGDPSELVEKIERFMSHPPEAEMEADNHWVKQLVGKSMVMDILLQLSRVARAELDTLILGETGTGKELLAEMYHQLSPRRKQRFYKIDSAEFTPNLFESQLFGHVSGAFSGANRDAKGKFEAANGGIAFFDEIGELNLDQQAKLLNLLQNKTVTRIGSTEPIRVDVVILAATNKNLYEMVREGKFRPDLFYRLHSNTLTIPPLRTRLEDLPLLVEHFLRKYKKVNPNVIGVDPEVLEKFQTFKWNGNVRSLEKCIEAGMANSSGQRITWKDVCKFCENEIQENGPGTGDYKVGFDLDYKNFKDLLKRIEHDYFQYHLEKNQHSVPKTAEALGFKSRQQLNEIIRRHGIGGRGDC